MTEAEKNRSSLIAYFESGSKENDRKLGVEVEHFIIVTSDGTPFTYAAQGSIPGVHEVLEHLLSTYPIIYQNSEGELIGAPMKRRRHPRTLFSDRDLDRAVFRSGADRSCLRALSRCDRPVPFCAWGEAGECGLPPYAQGRRAHAYS